MRFVDLFAGLGGFNLALTKLGHRCVFACELDSQLRDVYAANFGITPAADIRRVEPADIPSHEILCAGFPCQPFSKAGEQAGFNCPTNGDLFAHVMAIVRHHRPKFLLLENVANLKAHDDGRTWKSMLRRMRRAGYAVSAERMSPHHFGIPQIRDRLIIVASRGGLKKFSWPTRDFRVQTSIEDILDEHPAEARALSEKVIACLETWQAFLDAMPADVDFPPGPIWAMEFGATYPFEDATPHEKQSSLHHYCGSFGRSLTGLSPEERLKLLPSHARTPTSRFPEWKKRFIRANRTFYAANKSWIDPWLPQIQVFPSSLQKLEWNCTGEERAIWKYVIQFRASGVRVKRRTTAPSLIAMTTTQIPIIAWEKRYITVAECARLQSMNALATFPATYDAAFAALGNAINVRIIELVAGQLLPQVRVRRTAPKSRNNSKAA